MKPKIGMSILYKDVSYVVTHLFDDPVFPYVEVQTTDKNAKQQILAIPVKTFEKEAKHDTGPRVQDSSSRKSVSQSLC